jgi:RNA polymerase sigma-70 factor (ECF subfamily)
MNMNSADPFELLVSEHYQPLFRFAMSLTRDESDARDLTQHTFYTWAAKGHQLRDLSKVKTWLYTTLHRAFLQARRRQTRFPHQELDEVSPSLPVLEPDFVKRTDCSLVLPALEQVDDVFRGAVALFYLEDCSYKEIAAILDVPVGTVKSRIARGLQQLREILEDGGESLPRAVSRANNSSRAADCEENHFGGWDLSSTRITEQFSAA